MESSAFLQSAAMVMGWIGVVAIAVLSLVPGSLRPHTGLPGQMEHALAYGLTGMGSPAIACCCGSVLRRAAHFLSSCKTCRQGARLRSSTLSPALLA